MTTQSELKERVRARRENTGESCPTARRAVTAAAVAPAATVARPGHILRGGLHSDTSAIANVLANTGVLVGYWGALPVGILVSALIGAAASTTGPGDM